MYRRGNVAKKHCLIVIITCTLLIICAAISAAISYRKADSVTRNLAESKVTIEGLRTTNQELVTANKRLTETVGRLEEQIVADNKRAQERLREVEAGLVATATGLGEAGDTIQGIIEGIRSITEILKALQD